MINKIKYQIRTIALLNIINDVDVGKLVPNAYFQRNLVWRDIHKNDFIETILDGYPFPQIFISRGKLDLDTRTLISCIVDGQQRISTIVEYTKDKFQVNGKKFSDLTDEQKSEFFKYEIGVVELDLDNNDPRVKEMFKKVNRTSNSLTAIEKLSSEYGATEYMITAKVLADQIQKIQSEDESIGTDLYVDPEIDPQILVWIKSVSAKNYRKLIYESNIFDAREINRKIPLMYTLNLMSTYLGGFFKRNELTLRLLDDYSLNFEDKDRIIKLIDKSARIYLNFKFNKKSIFNQKSNFFSLMICLMEKEADINLIETKKNLIDFEKSIPEDYLLASREGVNNKREREIRDGYLRPLVV